MQSMTKDLDFERDTALARDFLLNFTNIHGETKYMNVLQEVANRKVLAVEIDLEDLFGYKDSDDEFIRRVTENTKRYVGVFADAIDALLPEPTQPLPEDDHDVLMMTQRSQDGAENADGSDPQ
ncbi:DNA replication licensing factor MCM7-like protein [Drosera capensis]